MYISKSRMVSVFCCGFVCCGVMALLATDVIAQGGRRGGGFRMGGGLAGMLGENEKLQEELKLEDEQIEEIKKFAEDQRSIMQEKIQEARDSGDRQGMREMFGEMRTSMAKAEAETMAKVLNDDQLKRYNQLSFQRKGVNALTEEAVAEKIGLSDDDKKAIQDAIDANNEKMREELQAMRDSGDRGAMRELMSEMREDLTKEIMGLLDDDQKKKLADLKGEAFEFPQRGGQRRQRQDF